MRTLFLCVLVSVLGACATPEATTPPTTLTQCTAPRPQVCTMQYEPVCANLVKGGTAEYSSGCNACADDAVGGFEKGQCPAP
ncbi:MAG: hypothetical protein ABJ013_15305 [Halioglobus sp.]